MVNELTNLTKTKKDLMRGLHSVYGFNFEKPYRVAKVCGSTTVKALEKAVCADKNDTVVALIRGTGYKNTVLYAVTLSPYFPQGFDIEGARSLNRVNGITWRTSFDYFYAKKQFTEARTNCKSEIIVVAQDYHYNFGHTNPEEFRARKENKVETKSIGVRHRILELDEQSYGTDITFSDRTNSNRTWYATARNRDNESVTDVIDKSGYYVKAYREALKKRADERRAEIKRAEFLKADFSGRVETLREVIKVKRELLANELRDATSLKDLRIVRDKLSYWHGLIDIVEDFEEFEQNIENKSFASIEACDALYNRILKNAMGEA